MADGLAVTPGVGATICTDQIAADSSHAQVVKLAIATDGIATLIPADATNGLLVDVSRVTGNVTVVDGGATFSVDDGGGSLGVDDNAGSLTVDAPATTPVFVRLSDGTAAIATLPVSDAAGSLTVDDAAANLSIDDGVNTITVDGTVAVTQSTPAAVASGWPVKITDGTDTVGISTVTADKAMKVDVIKSVDLTVGQQDKTAFTEGTTKVQVIGGVYNETLAGDPTEDQASIARITAKRALHVNLRNSSGFEVGATAYPFQVAPSFHYAGRTTKQVALTASQTGVTLWDPAAGFKFVVTSFFLVVSGAGVCTFFDETNVAAGTLLKGTFAVADKVNHEFIWGWPSSAVDNILKYTSGVGFAGEITLHGYET